MVTDWTVKKNYAKNIRFKKKPEIEKADERFVVTMTKQQKDTIVAYCKSQGLVCSEFIRGLIGEYFSKVRFSLPGDPEEDKSQLKIF